MNSDRAKVSLPNNKILMIQNQTICRQHNKCSINYVGKGGKYSEKKRTRGT